MASLAKLNHIARVLEHELDMRPLSLILCKGGTDRECAAIAKIFARAGMDLADNNAVLPGLRLEANKPPAEQYARELMRRAARLEPAGQ